MITGQYRKRLEKPGIFQARGEKKTPPVVIKVSYVQFDHVIGSCLISASFTSEFFMCVRVHTHILAQRSGLKLGASDVEDKFHELFMFHCTNGSNVRGVEKAGTLFCGVGEGLDRTNTTLLNQNAGYKIITVAPLYIVVSPVHL
jgi:hypothetical protein